MPIFLSDILAINLAKCLCKTRYADERTEGVNDIIFDTSAKEFDKRYIAETEYDKRKRKGVVERVQNHRREE